MTKLDHSPSRSSLDKEAALAVTRTAEAEAHDPDMFISKEDDARIRKKADKHLLPILCAVYALQFLDKTCMSYAAIMGFRQANHLNTSQYSWLGSIFYLGYLVGEYPMCYVLQRFPIAKVTGMNAIIWGGVLCLMAIDKGFIYLMVIRFLLGFFESSITPALALFTGQWYKLREQGTRTGVWFAMNGFGYIFGGAIAYGLVKADLEHKLAIPGWKVIYILLGLMTAVAGFLVLLFIPDTPDKAWFLSEEDKKLAAIRVRGNQQPVESKWEWSQVKEALTDPLTLMYCLVGILTCIPNGLLTNFFTIIIQSFGFTSLQTLLLGMPNSWLAFNYFGWLWLGDKLRNRCLVGIVPCCISVVGLCLVWLLPPHMKIGRLVGCYIVIPYIICLAATMSLITSNVAGKTKKSTVNALYLIFYCVGNLIGPQIFRDKDAPKYTPAYLTCVLCVILTGVCMVGIDLIYRYENKKRDRLEVLNGVHDFKPEEDLTDRQNPHFRYTP